MIRSIEQFFRFFVGIIFVFSGLIKINDPIGTSIKLKEYFEVFANDFASFFQFFTPHTLILGIVIIILEVLLGVALLINYRISIIAWLFLILIIFFTFLTFYSAYFNKVTDCGCFGDAIPLSPWESFLKDIVLLAMIVFIFIRRSSYKQLLPGYQGDIIIGIILIINTFLAIYAVRHLPYIDFRPYKTGNNIPQLMQPSEPYRYKYIFEKDGKTYEFMDYPSDTTFQYKDLVLLNPKAQPKITDYHIWNDEDDFTEESFTGNKLLVIFFDVSRASTKHIYKIKALIEEINPEVEAWAITASSEENFEAFRHEYQLAIPYYFADMTVLEAIIRSNPGLWLLKEGTVMGKWHHNDVPDPEIILKLVE